MRRNRIIIAVGAAAAAVSGCSQAPTVSDGVTRVEPVLRVPTARDSFDAQFALGRYELAQNRVAAAIDNFERAVELRPHDAGARNALGVAYATAGRFDASIVSFKEALRLAPGSAHVVSNLGLALLRMGRLDAAESTLLHAQRLDPADSTIRENIALLRAARGGAPVAASAGNGNGNGIGDAGRPRESLAGNSPAPQGAALVQVAPNVFELRNAVVAGRSSSPAAAAEAPPLIAARPGENTSLRHGVDSAGQAIAGTQPVVPTPSSAPVSADSTAAAPQGSVARSALSPDSIAPQVKPMPAMLVSGLEVSNGAGATGLAKRTARSLAVIGFKATHISNHQDFRQTSSRIEYRVGHMKSAQALGALLPVSPRVIRSSQLRPGIDLRLVIGRDLAGARIVAWVDRRDAVLVSAAPRSDVPVDSAAGTLGALAQAGVGRREFADLVASLRVGEGWRWH